MKFGEALKNKGAPPAEMLDYYRKVGVTPPTGEPVAPPPAGSMKNYTETSFVTRQRMSLHRIADNLDCIVNSNPDKKR